MFKSEFQWYICMCIYTHTYIISKQELHAEWEKCRNASRVNLWPFDIIDGSQEEEIGDMG